MNNLTYSDAGLEMTKGFEGLRLSAYRDVAGVLTIGYGHTGTDVHEGMSIDEDDAISLLLADLRDAVACVNEVVTVELNQNQFDGLVDFVFNVGRGSFEHSTLLEKLNAGDYAGAAEQFGRWVHAGIAVAAGLVRRRKAEMQLFLQAV
jgi:lysozyme